MGAVLIACLAGLAAAAAVAFFTRAEPTRGLGGWLDRLVLNAELGDLFDRAVVNRLVAELHACSRQVIVSVRHRLRGPVLRIATEEVVLELHLYIEPHDPLLRHSHTLNAELTNLEYADGEGWRATVQDLRGQRQYSGWLIRGRPCATPPTGSNGASSPA